MARKKLDLPKWSGSLKTPIETGLLWDLTNRESIEASADEDQRKLTEQRLEKLPELGRQLGMKEMPEFSEDDPATHLTMIWYYEALLLGLAVKIGIPGFLRKSSRRWPAELVAKALEACDLFKQHPDPEMRTDLATCRFLVGKTNPSLSRSEIRAQALQLCNRVSQLRSERGSRRKRRLGARGARRPRKPLH